ncbi:MAG: serine hydrolase domain-containing protein [Bacteroidota bacterium]
MYQKSLSLILLLLIAALSQAQDLDKLSQKTDKFFNKYISDDSPGAAVVVILGGKVVHKNTYGLADYEHKIPLSTNSVFDIASVSKQFVGYAVALLEKEGKLSLTDNVRSYIPEFPDFGHPITIGHLLYHQSGLRDWPSAMKLAGVGFDDVLSFDQILSMVYRQEALNFIPGSRYIYSNTGYNVLVELIQRITKKPFRVWTKEQIFEPLGMKHTFFKDQFNESIPRAVKSYFKEDDEIKVSFNGLTALGSSSLQTTLDDFALWLQYLDSEAAKDLINKMQLVGKLSTAEPANYAYGLEVDTYYGLKRIYHDGSWASFNTYMAYFPDQQFSVAVFLNHDNWAEGFAQEVMKLYLKDELQEGVEEAGFYDEEQPEIPKDLKLDLSPYTGIYYLEKYLIYLNIFEEKGKLFVEATGEDKQLMQAVSDSRFWVNAYDASIYFNIDKSGKVESLNYHNSLCERRPLKPAQAELQLSSYEGNYYSRELNTTYKVSAKEGKLYLSHLRNGQISLAQIWKDGFITETEYAPLIDFQRNAEGEIISLTVSQFRSRNQLFKKLAEED